MSLRRTVACATALGVIAAPVSIAPALAAPAFPATASGTLVGLSVAPGEGGVEGLWGTIYVSSEVGGERLTADTGNDPGGLLGPVSVVGPTQVSVNTTATGEGRAEAVAELGGLTLTLLGTDVPAVEVGPLYNSLTCDFSGDLTWETGPEDERTVTVFGTPVAPSDTGETTDVTLPDGRTAEVTVTDRVPDGDDTGEGRIHTAVVATVDETELFDLTMAAVAVECPTDGTGERDAPETDGPAEERDDDAREPSEEGTEPPADETDEGVDGSTGGADGTPEGAEQSSPPPAPAADGEGSEAGPSGLPLTGAALAALVTAGVLALGGGGLVLYLARRRTHHPTDEG
ncbi:hypothetical protein [Nocardiopsis lambiniae]|uniref:LPXTG cell wall anchor domain-containing protein n=1 Tax=Nocardiopsis lambiniae TaxID=3075539 RepID=A0ABU2MCF0_9ACTN|nr:hypothetical protein [Nocardiopsis sp. DSM 44743]MDT0329601.1 hypothetical protein [Nocardiopsis sp. DSM 44743]